MDTAIIEDRILDFISDCWENQYSLEILLFLGRHPCAQFNEIVFVRGSTGQRMDLERAMRTLVGKGLVRVHTNSYMPLFSLTRDEPVRSLVTRLVGLSRRQLQCAMQQVLDRREMPREQPAAT